MHHELPRRLDLDYYRKQAKALVRGFRANEPEAVERVEDVLGGRERARFLLSDAQHVITSEHGYRRWADFKRAIDSAPPERPVGRIGLADVSFYRQRADDLLAELRAGGEGAARRVRAHVPRLADLDEGRLRASELSARDARLVIAREYGFPTWRQLVHYAQKAIADAAQEPRAARVAGREAVASGDVARLRELLALDGGLASDLLEDLTQPDVFGERLGAPLGVDRACVDVLVAAADNLDVCLNLAACFDRVELVALLLDAGADVESVEIWGVTPLETALYHGSRRAADLLANRTIVPYALWVVSALGRLDLMRAFFEPGGQLRAEAGAHRPDLSKVGWPPGPPPRDEPREILEEALVHACHNGRGEAAAWLLDRGVDVNARPYLGVTGLHLAAQFGHLSTVRLLLDRGADPELVDGIHGGTPLGWAAFQAERDPSRRSIRDLLALRSSAGNRARSMPPEAKRLRLAVELDAASRDWHDLGEVVIDSGIEYADGDPVRVRVRKRGHRYTIDDDGVAVAKAGRPPGWFRVAEGVVAEDWLNLNRRGVVFVPAVEGGLDRASLVRRIADRSAAVYQALLELDDE